MAVIIVTGAAGFIGMHVSRKLLERGDTVIGIDNMNDYYAIGLKRDRLAHLTAFDNFIFYEADIADSKTMFDIFKTYRKTVTDVIHLAAQAGVRYSLENPLAYISANVTGHTVICESIRHYAPHIRHFVFASSSSVYGNSHRTPFSISDNTDYPISLYAATKKADEMIAYTYARLYGIPTTGLRFFTVYGPWGRPDMSPVLFADAIAKGTPLKVFNHGDMKRDFTYIDDIVAGVLLTVDGAPAKRPDDGVPYRILNLGNNRSENLMDYIREIEKAMGKTTEKVMLPMQPGDVYETYADITETMAAIGYKPTTPISVGIPKFIQWYKDYYKAG